MQTDSEPRTLPGPPDLPKLGVSTAGEGDIALLRFEGTIDEQFGGAALAASVAEGTGMLIVDLGGIRKISSFGIREWVDFMTAARTRARAILLVECAPKVVDQLNMVANFASGARVYSVYAPFRCDFCDADHRVLLQVDRDADAIKAMTLPERPCVTCKQAMYFDDDGATFFSYLVGQPRVELSPAVAAFLASRLDYVLADGSRKLRIDKLVDGRATFLRLVGDLDRTFPRDKLAEGLEGEVFVDVAGIARIDPAGAAEWRAFVQTVSPGIEHLWIAGASPAFRDRLASAEDLGAKAALLDDGTVTPELRTRLDGLRARAASTRPSASRLPRRPSASTLGPASMPPPAVVEVRRTPLWVPVAAALIALAVAGGGMVAYRMLASGGVTTDANGLGAVEARSADARAAWATDTIGCTATAGSGMTCVGVSSPVARQDDAEDEAADAAYDALAAALVVRITDKAWRARVLPIFQAARDAKLAAFDRDPGNTQARRDVREARRAVAQLLRATGGGATPAVPTARYWERHTSADGTRVVAYAQLALAPAELARLVETYSHGEPALGGTAVTMFPGVGWRFPHVERGAILTALGPGVLQDIGLAEGYAILAVAGRDVPDAAAFARLATDEDAAARAHGGVLRLKVQAGDGAPREFTRTFPDPTATPPAVPQTPVGPTVHEVPTGSVNVWDRYGGNGHGSAAPK